MTDAPAPPDDDFIQLLIAHQTQIRGVVLAGLGNYADCQDVLQKTNLALWRKAAEFDRSRSFQAWAVGVARFEILAFIRDRQRDRHVFAPEVADMLVAEAEEQLREPPARQAALRDCIHELPEPSRRVLTLKYVHGMSIDRISEAVGRSADGVKSLLLRVRKLLAACIERRVAAGV